jgi:NADH:ubiquinone oxidoreductase subunit K
MIAYLPAAILGFSGLVCILLRKSMLKVLVGGLLVSMSGSYAFIAAGSSGAPGLLAAVYGVLCYLVGISQLVMGLALATRLFYLRGNAELSELRNLRR